MTRGRTVRGPAALTATGAVAGLAVTLAVLAVPQLHFAYRNPPAHLVLETTDAGIAALVALLFVVRVRRERLRRDLLLGYAATLFVVADVVFVVVPLLAGAARTAMVTTWAPMLLRLAGAGLFAAAAAAPATATVRWRPTRDAAVLGTVGAGLLALSLAAPHLLPVAVDPGLAPERSGSPHVGGHPLVAALQLLSCLCYAAAAVLFTREATRGDDDFLGWLGAAAAVTAFARLNYALFPSLFSTYLYTGDLLRTAAYLLMLVGGIREIERYSATTAEAAVLGERQRLARDLHDGLVQELTFMWGQLQRLAADPDRSTEVVPRVAGATERAIDEARRAIAALTRPIDEPLRVALAQAAEEVAQRYDATVDHDIADVAADPERREAMIRIVREAVGNAVRHGGVRRVGVRLTGGRPLRLTVDDTGAGFDPARPTGGFGLTTMRQRAETTGATFRVDSSPGAGTTVSVVWP